MLSLLFTLTCVTTAYAWTGPQIATHLEHNLSPGSKVFLPTDANYTQETVQRWNIYEEPIYIVSVEPALDTDVQKIVSSVDFSRLSALLVSA